VSHRQWITVSIAGSSGRVSLVDLDPEDAPQASVARACGYHPAIGDRARERWAVLTVWILAALAVILAVLAAIHAPFILPF
jgi:hypothetical protein